MSVNFRIVRVQGNFSSGIYDVWEIVNEYNEQNWSKNASGWGTPEVTDDHAEATPSTTTLWVLPFK
jgi:hypothetical protein